MSEHRLPDDIGRWPRDPYALLGVDADASQRDVRRAYVRLIRQFQPGTHPDHFQRIRGAYEQIVSRNERREFGHAEDTPLLFFPTSVESGEVDALNFAWGESRGNSFPGGHEPSDDVASAWQLVRQGDPATAYRRLASLASRASLAEEASLRLYWLLAAMPKLSESDTHHDWLVRALRASRLTGPAMELLRQLFGRDPGQALAEAYTALLDCDAAPGNRLRLFEIRLQALSRLGLPEQIFKDLDRLGESLRERNEEIRGHALCLACTHLVWLPRARLVGERLTALRQELEEIASNHPSLHEILFHLDITVDTARGWWQLREDQVAPKPLLDFVLLSATQPDDVAQAAMSRLIDHLGEDSWKALVQLDRIAAVAPAVLPYLDLHLRLPMEPFLVESSGLDSASLQELARLFLSSHSGDYGANRGSLLAFCLREGIAIHEITPWLDRLEVPSGGLPQPWKSLVENDLPLQCAATLCQRFRLPVAETFAGGCG